MTGNSRQIDTARAPRFDSMPEAMRSGMLAPQNALRILRHRTGGNISRATFYRWISNGTIGSIRLGSRILIPWPALEELVRRCFEGD